MELETGREQLVAIGRASNAMANRLGEHYENRVQILVQDKDIARFLISSEKADLMVWLPVNCRECDEDEVCEVDMSTVHLNLGKAETVLMETRGDAHVRITDMAKRGEEPLDVLDKYDTVELSSALAKIDEVELQARVRVDALLEMLERLIPMADSASLDKFKCLWLSFDHDEVQGLATNGQMAFFGSVGADVRSKPVDPICYDLSYMIALLELCHLWSKRARVADAIYCNIYWVEAESQYLFNLSGGCIEASILAMDLDCGFDPCFMGSWNMFEYRQGVSFKVDSEELDGRLDSAEAVLASVQKESIELRIKDRKVYFRVEDCNGEEAAVSPMVIRDPVWNSLPGHAVTLHMCPNLLRSVLRKEKGTISIRVPTNLDGLPIPYYVVPKSNCNARYTLMPAQGGCHE